MKVSEFIVNYLAEIGIKHVFLITGGAVAFIVDEFSKRKDIDYICMQHEQCAAMAADAYSRMGPNLGVAMGTSGPGATNLITGICCSYFDSIPTLCITGQVNTNELSKPNTVRQLGFQETKIIEIVKPITKFAEKLENPADIKYLLQKATCIAKEGRPGPVLVDIPINLQYVDINPKKLRNFNPKELVDISNDQGYKLQKKIDELISLIKETKRPVILVGHGIRIAKAEKEIEKFTNLLKFPIVSTWSALDLFPYKHPLFVGTSGVYGSQGANFTIQNADLLISIGARLDTRQTGRASGYARAAKIVAIDIDKAELNKKRVSLDISINCDAKVFLLEFLKHKEKIQKKPTSDWLKKTLSWKKTFPNLKPNYFKQKKFINPYVFESVLSDLLPKNALVIPDEGGNLTWTMQGIKLKVGQRLFSAFGNSPMGYALPASVGAALALQNKRQVITITGDGGLQINIQEFQTIIHYKLPIKIFVLNNQSYGIIKQFQDSWLNGRYEASSKGYSVPDFVSIAKAYGLTTFKIENHKQLKNKIQEALKTKGPVFVDVSLDPDQKIAPKLEFGRPLEDLSPLLSKEEFLKNMLVEPLQESLKIRS